MIQIKNLRLTHKKDLRILLEDFQLVLNKGDKAVIIGEEGNGKSTLLKWIYNPESIENYIEAEGERICTGEKIGYLPQELLEAQKGLSVYEFFCEEPLFFEQTPKEMGKLAQDLHVAVDFFYGEQKMCTLSGGERIKAQIARVLMAQPTVLLLDEPSNDIDIETLEWLEKLICETQQAVLYISHDETLIERTANMVVHIEQLRRKTVSRYTIAHVPYTQYIKARNEGFKKQEQEALNERREERVRQEKFRCIEQSVAHDLNTISRQDPAGGRLLKKKMKVVKSMEKRYEREKENMTQLPEYEEAIGFKFDETINVPNGKTVLEFSLERLMTPSDCEMQRLLSEDIFLRVRGPEKICIIGQNGMGKTTLLKLIWQSLSERSDLQVAYMPQNYEELLDMNQTPIEYLTTTGDKEEITKIRTYLGAMKYTADEMSHAISELSGGQRAKILLLKMNLSGANVLILDEPTRNFSPLSSPIIRRMLASFGGAIISISHDRKYISKVCDKVYRLTPQGLNLED